EQVTVECLQIRPGPRSLVHFTGEEAPDGPGPRPRDAAPPSGTPGVAPFLPNPRLRRLQDYRGRSVFSLLDSTSLVWKPSEEVILFSKGIWFRACVIKLEFTCCSSTSPLTPPHFFFFDCHPSFWTKDRICVERCCTSLWMESDWK
uniref:Uncharacterized protein n=1 Tax=Panthera leo TaxID=9689 RepID=A0A8C8WUZ3_PANLE